MESKGRVPGILNTVSDLAALTSRGAGLCASGIKATLKEYEATTDDDQGPRASPETGKTEACGPGARRTRLIERHVPADPNVINGDTTSKGDQGKTPPTEGACGNDAVLKVLPWRWETPA